MLLFGPNIRELKEKGDIKGLIKELYEETPAEKHENSPWSIFSAIIGFLIGVVIFIKYSDMPLFIAAPLSLFWAVGFAALFYGIAYIPAWLYCKSKHNKKTEIRLEVVNALGELKHTEGLITALGNDVPEVCNAAIEALKNLTPIGDSKAIKALVDYFLSAKSSSIHEKVFEVLDKSDVDAGTWQSMAYKLAEQKRYDKSLECCKMGIKIDPDNDYLWCLKGRVLWRQGREEEAKASFKKAIDLSPNNIDIRRVADISEKSIKESSEDWRQLQRERQVAQAYWKQMKDRGILSQLAHVIETIGWKYKDMGSGKAIEDETGVKYFVTGIILAPYMRVLSLEGTKWGIVLKCQLNILEGATSHPFWKYHSFNEDIRKFNFETHIDPEVFTEDDLAECFQYIIEGDESKKKPRIAPKQAPDLYIQLLSL